MKKIFSFVFILLVMLMLPLSVKAANETVTIYLVRGEGCPHCEEALTYFKKLIRKKEFKDYVEVRALEVWNNDDNFEIAKKMYEVMGETTAFSGSVPYIVVGGKAFHGYSSSSNQEIEDLLRSTHNSTEFQDSLKSVVGDAGEVLKAGDTNIVATVSVIGVIVVVLGIVFILARKDTLAPVEEPKKEEKVIETKEEQEPVKVENKKTETTKTTSSKQNTKKKTKKKNSNNKSKKAE